MKFLLLISLICGLIVANRAAVSRGIYNDPKYPGKCFVRGVLMSPGDVAQHPTAECCRMICGTEGHVVFHTCGAILPPEGYKLGERLEPLAAYPKCCEREFLLILREPEDPETFHYQ